MIRRWLRKVLALVRAFLRDLYCDPEAYAQAVEDAVTGMAGGEDE